MNPFNVLPTDPEWAAKLDAINKAAAHDLGAMVLLVAVQPEGKLCVSVDGVPADGALYDMAHNLPRFLALLSGICAHLDRMGEHELRH